MIVIATNNGSNYLPNLLSSIDLHGTKDHKICIVDTGSTDENFINYLDSLDRNKYIVTKTTDKGYDTGAYIHAYKNFPSDDYIFLHDSMTVLTDTWIDDFTSPNTDVCYYSTFHTAFDTAEQAQQLHNLGIYNNNTSNCIFGPIFYIKKSILDLIDDRFKLNNVIPRTKMDQQGMERGWAMMVDHVTTSRTWLSVLISLGEENVLYKNLRKFRPVRA